MIRRPPRSTLDRSSAASDVYKRQLKEGGKALIEEAKKKAAMAILSNPYVLAAIGIISVSYTHLRAHETVLDLVCRLLLEKKNTKTTINVFLIHKQTVKSNSAHLSPSITYRTEDNNICTN